MLDAAPIIVPGMTSPTAFPSCRQAISSFITILLVLSSLPSVLSLSHSPQHNHNHNHNHILHQQAQAHNNATGPPFVQLPLHGGLLHASGFFFNATLGDQHFTLQVDLSYSSLIVPTHLCTGCRVGDRRYTPPASALVPCSDARCHSKLDGDCSASLTPKSRSVCYNCSSRGRCCVASDDENEACAFNVVYGDASAGNGSLYHDALHLGDAVRVDVLFGGMFSESHNFEMPYSDGVFGLAFQKGSCKPTCFPPLMDQIVAGSKLSNVFTLCVNTAGGILSLGRADTSLLAAGADFAYVDVLDEYKDNRYVTAALPQWTVNERSVAMPGVTKVMLTAGISDIAVSKTSFMALIEHLMSYYCDIPGLCAFDSWFRPQHCTYLDNDVLKAMPNITIALTQRVSITLLPDDYLLPFKVVQGKQVRCVAFIVSETMGDIGMLVGNTIYKRYTVAFDRDAKRIGFGHSVGAPTCGSETQSQEGLPRMPGEPGTLLTADAPAQPLAEADQAVPKDEHQEEVCRAFKSCTQCASNASCSYGYEHGDCVPVQDSVGNTPYPYCHGGLCACFATGNSGWYAGVVIGVLLALAFAIVAWYVWKKRRERNVYTAVSTFQEQDLDTF